MHTTKIATCCYCGTRAALVFDHTQHELSCSTCGAPLHNMKALPERKVAVVTPTPAKVKPSAETRRRYADIPAKKSVKSRNKKKKFGILDRKSIGKIWDVVEDIFD